MLAVVGLAGGACSADREANPAYTRCEHDSDCARGTCERGYCVGGGQASMDGSTPDDGAAPNDGAALDGGDAGGEGGDEDGGQPAPPEPCDEQGATKACYSGPPGSQVKGICRAGLKTCVDGFFGPCIDEIVPMERELCNGEDDDCDGTTEDELTALASCPTRMFGACGEGIEICVEGGNLVCAQTVNPAIEICNGEDDDCDGATDEGNIAEAACYTGNGGCTEVEAGVYECEGACRAGTQQCDEGRMQPCSGQVTPAADEDCDLVDGIAVDDNCNGEIDEGCSCTNTETQPCYRGPEGTRDNEPCMAGTQTCTGGQWGDCVGDHLPGVETCADEGVDDDCNGELDDIPMQGFSCENDANVGRCAVGTLECVGNALECVTPDPREETCDSTDDDCAGGVDEGFNLQNDPANCGMCGKACLANQTCCAGTCVNTSTSQAHCGMCGRACGAGLTCCGGGCVNFQNDPMHCGSCTNRCGGLTGACCSGSCGTVCL